MFFRFIFSSFSHKKLFSLLCKMKRNKHFFCYFPSIFLLPFRFFSLQAKIRGHPSPKSHFQINLQLRRGKGVNAGLSSVLCHARRFSSDSFSENFFTCGKFFCRTTNKEKGSTDLHVSMRVSLKWRLRARIFFCHFLYEKGIILKN
jgi:hypothetical protein